MLLVRFHRAKSNRSLGGMASDPVDAALATLARRLGCELGTRMEEETVTKTQNKGNLAGSKTRLATMNKANRRLFLFAKTKLNQINTTVLTIPTS